MKAPPPSALTSPASAVRQTRAIYIRQIEAALDPLSGPFVHAVHVHNARKQLKRARATLRILRAAIPDQTYRRENAALRDAARPLSDARDAEVLLQTYAKLLRRLDAAQRGAKLDLLQQTLRQERQRAAAAIQRDVVKRVRNALEQAARRAARWRTTGNRLLLLRGAASTYRRARKAFRKAKRGKSAEQLHEWRKQNKYLLHELEILRPVAPRRLQALTEQIKKTSDALGDEHDLHVLCLRVTEQRSSLTKADATALTHTIHKRRARLQTKALALGEKTYRAAPSEFERQLTQAWARWARAARKQKNER